MIHFYLDIVSYSHGIIIPLKAIQIELCFDIINYDHHNNLDRNTFKLFEWYVIYSPYNPELIIFNLGQIIYNADK